MRIAVVDDEPLARQALRLMLREEADMDCVGEARTATQAIALLDRQQPDAVFLDIEMPGASGLDVLRQIERIPMVVFTTAFDRYAVDAFDFEAVDFLLKPFGRRRLRQAVIKLRKAATRIAPPARHLRRLFASRPGSVVPLLVDGIELFQSAGDYVRVHTGGSEYLVSHRLKDLESGLDAERFIRIHRSWIVNLDFVQAIEADDNGTLVVRMRTGAQLPVSRRRARALRVRLSGNEVP